MVDRPRDIVNKDVREGFVPTGRAMTGISTAVKEFTFAQQNGSAVGRVKTEKLNALHVQALGLIVLNLLLIRGGAT